MVPGRVVLVVLCREQRCASNQSHPSPPDQPIPSTSILPSSCSRTQGLLQLVTWIAFCASPLCFPSSIPRSCVSAHRFSYFLLQYDIVPLCVFQTSRSAACFSATLKRSNFFRLLRRPFQAPLNETRVSSTRHAKSPPTSHHPSSNSNQHEGCKASSLRGRAWL